MSIASEITRIAGLRDNIRAKLISWGVVTDSSAKLSVCATAINGISDSALTVSTISVTPALSLNSSTGLVTASGSASGTASASKGYSKGISKSVSAVASNTLQLTVYDGTIA